LPFASLKGKKRAHNQNTGKFKNSVVFLQLYRKFQEKWLLEYVFEDLLTWNPRWPKNRDRKGLLCSGSNPVEPPLKSDYATNAWQGAAYESGLDNSPMNDGVPFNKQTHLLELADAGLTSQYVMDCDALAEISIIQGKNDEAGELNKRGDYYRNNLGLKNYHLPEATKILAEKLNQLFMENVKLNGYVYENYNAITGNKADPAEEKRMGDNYYHWGTLLGFMALMEFVQTE
jgi:hypothetical protein